MEKKSKAEKKDSKEVSKNVFGKNLEGKENKQLNYIIIIMAAVIIIFFIAYLFFQESKNIDYKGLKFEKIMYGSLPLYHTKLPVKTLQGAVIANFNLFLRNDPRKLDKIPIEPAEGGIKLMKNIMVISIDEDLICEDNGIAGVSLGEFLRASGINTIAGTTNISESNESGIAYADCSSSDYLTLMIEKADETRIIQETLYCYRIEVANCEIVKAIERFMIGAITNSKSYAL